MNFSKTNLYAYSQAVFWRFRFAYAIRFEGFPAFFVFLCGAVVKTDYFYRWVRVWCMFLNFIRYSWLDPHSSITIDEFLLWGYSGTLFSWDKEECCFIGVQERYGWFFCFVTCYLSRYRVVLSKNFFPVIILSIRFACCIYPVARVIIVVKKNKVYVDVPAVEGPEAVAII